MDEQKPTEPRVELWRLQEHRRWRLSLRYFRWLERRWWLVAIPITALGWAITFGWARDLRGTLIVLPVAYFVAAIAVRFAGRWGRKEAEEWLARWGGRNGG